MSRENQIKRNIQKDIDEIKQVLESEKNEEELKRIHIMIDGKYQNRISNFGHSCYNWYDKNGFDYNYMGIDTLKHNLLIMRSKLEGYLQTFTIVPVTSSKTVNNIIKNENINKNENNNSNTNVNKNEINFKNIQEVIKNMESLTNEETTEALEKLDELEKIYNSKESRKNKWEMAKKILVWVADKSVDIAISFFPIIMDVLSK